MDPAQILDSVNTFYSNAFAWLLAITVAILGFAGILMPIILQNQQLRSFKTEKSSLEAQIKAETEQIRKELRAELETQFQAEKEAVRQHLASQTHEIEKTLEKQLSVIRAGTAYVQASAYLAASNYPFAASDFAAAATSSLAGADEMNGRRALEALRLSCLPQLNSSSFEIDRNLDSRIGDLLQVLDTVNANGRYFDDISAIRHQWESAKKKTPPIG